MQAAGLICFACGFVYADVVSIGGFVSPGVVRNQMLVHEESASFDSSCKTSLCLSTWVGMQA